jgi:quercetin dioxygenase-like cupin family protein
MAITHAISGQALDVHPLGDAIFGQRTKALFKTHDLEVIRLVLLAGKSLPPQKVAGDITIHCLEGRLAIELHDSKVTLDAGELPFLEGEAMHGVLAMSDASALVTIALKPAALADHLDRDIPPGGA